MPGHFASFFTRICHSYATLSTIDHFMEEEWLFDAITEAYIPLLRAMQRLVGDSVPFKLTMSITPTLCAMLQDQLLCERYVRHLDLLIDLAARERKRNRKHPQLRELAEFYIDVFSDARRHFVDEWKCDLLLVFRELQQTGALEIIASAATHGLLPILQQQSSRAARAQVLIGRDVHVELFGEEATGFWFAHAAPFTLLVTHQQGQRLLPATRCQPPNLECVGGLSRRSSVPGFLPRHRF